MDNSLAVTGQGGSRGMENNTGNSLLLVTLQSKMLKTDCWKLLALTEDDRGMKYERTE